MQARLTHDFRAQRDALFQSESRVCLAVVDLETYPTFVSKKADHLDLLQHLCAQMEALTATMWEVPDMPLHLRLLFARDHREGEELARSGHYIIAAGRVRTFGKLCLVNQERLLDCARHKDHDLERRCRATEAHCPHLLLVPPGIYEVTIYSGSVPVGRGGPPSEVGALDYNVVLRHYPHPPPRFAPVRLGSMIPWAGTETAVNARPFGF
jgi:hypothetical protein